MTETLSVRASVLQLALLSPPQAQLEASGHLFSQFVLGAGSDPVSLLRSTVTNSGFH